MTYDLTRTPSNFGVAPRGRRLRLLARNAERLNQTKQVRVY